MIPGARVQAAIELLDQITAAGATAPADRLVGNYFRSRRYAGSKDRRAVTETVYDVLRRQGEYAWRAGGGDSRRLVLAHLMAEANGDLEARASGVAALFDAARFCPANLDVDEQAALRQLSRQDKTEAPAWVVGNYPEWLHAPLARRFGADLGAEMASMQGRAAVDLRANTLKSSRDDLMAAMTADDIPVTPGALAPTALRLNSRRAMTGHPLYQGGAIEIQDEGSQLVALLCDARPGQQVIDYCAGGGGKSLGLAARMANKGQIFAFDSAPQRLRPLRARLQRAGARNIQVHALADAAAIAALANLTGKADRVLLDVPCSGSGAWRRNPESKWRLTADKLSQYSALQDEILRRAAPLVAPGGRLIYATCSLLMEENEDRIESFLGEQSGFGVLPISGVWDEVLDTACPNDVRDGAYLRLTPAGHGTDGFFVAILERRADT